MKNGLCKRNRAAASVLVLFAAAVLILTAGASGANAVQAAGNDRIAELSAASVASDAVEASSWEDLARALIDGENVVLSADIEAPASDDPLGSAYLGAGYEEHEYGDVEALGQGYYRHYIVVGRKSASSDPIVLDLNGHTLTLKQTYLVIDQGKTLTVNGGGSQAQGNIAYQDENGGTSYCPSYGRIDGAYYAAIELGGNDSAVNLNGVIFTGNGVKESSYGAAIVGGAFSGDDFAAEGTIALRVSDCYFVGNGASVRFFRMDDTEHAERHYSGTIDIERSVFSGGHFGGNGGAIYAERTDLTVRDSVFASNESNSSGGAIYATNGSTLTAEGCSFVKNNAPGGGGVLYVTNSGSLTVEDCTFVENNATGGGGAIYVTNGSKSTVKGSRFRANETAGYGGAVYTTSGSPLTVEGCFFEKNEGPGGGGAIYTANSSETIVTDSEFSANDASLGSGGAVYASGGSYLTVNGGRFVSNTSSGSNGGSGGAIYYNGGTLTVTGAMLSGNSVNYGSGGAIHMENGTMIISGASLTGNRSVKGGAIYARSLTFTLKETVFTGNTTGTNGDGGAIFMESGSLTMTDTEFNANSAYYKGGAICMSSGAIYMYGKSSMHGNGAGEGCAVNAVSGVTLYMYDESSMYSNYLNRSTSGAGGAVKLSNGSTLLMYNQSSLHDNTSYAGGAVQAGGLSDSNDGNCTIVMYGESSMYNNHTTSESGGAVALYRHSILVMNNKTSLHHNTSKRAGGAVAAGAYNTEHGGCTITMNDEASIYDNMGYGEGSGGGGGGIAMFQGNTLNMNGKSSLLRNYTYGVGGGVFAYYNNTVNLSGSPVVNENTALMGGGLWVSYYSTLRVNGGEISYNKTIRNRYDTGPAISTGGSSSVGGGIFAYNESTEVYLSGAKIIGNTADHEGGGIAVSNLKSLIISGCTISDNTTQATGGGIHAASVGTIELNGVTLSGNKSAYRGGGIAVFGNGSTKFTVRSSNITNNETWNDTISTDYYYDCALGGGIFYYSATTTIEGTNITGNKAQGHGGGICVGYSNSTLTINGGSISNNAAGTGYGVLEPETNPNRQYYNMFGGGGLYASNGSLEINGTLFDGNTAFDGGAIYSGNITMKINGATISNNISEKDGGGIVIDDSTTTLSNITIKNNISRQNGGGAYITGSGTVTVNNLVSVNNKAENNGGGLAVGPEKGSSVTVVLNGGTIADNTSKYNGGGIVLYPNASLELNGVSVVNNTAGLNINGEETEGADGGGIYAESGSAITVNSGSYINGNTARSNGGGVYLDGSGRNELRVSGGQICGNTAANGSGGAVYSSNDTLTIENGALIAGNKAMAFLANGGGIFATGGSKLSTDTGAGITGNTAFGSGGGIYMGPGVSLDMKETTVEGNKAYYAGGGICAVARTAPIIPALGELCAETTAQNNAFLVKDSVIRNNAALGTSWAVPESPVEMGNGGGIYLSEGYAEVSISGSTISDNFAAKNGGGICSVNVSKEEDGRTVLDIRSTAISGNTAGNADGSKVDDNVPEAQREYGNGGGVYMEGSELTIDDGLIITGNTALAEGGGIYATRHFVDGIGPDGELGGWYAHVKDYSAASVITMNGGEISGNLAKGQGVRVAEDPDNDWGYGGGGVCVKSSAFYMHGGVIKENGSLTSGGGLLLNNRNGWDKNADSTPYSTLVMDGGRFEGNVAQKREGGGITLINADGIVTGGQFLNNKTGYLVDDPEEANPAYGDWGGGGIFVAQRSTLKIPTTVLVTKNEAGGFGGGVADCSTGFIFTYNGEDAGVAIYDNLARNLTPNLTGEGTTKPEDHDAANDKVFMENHYYQDYYGENFTYIQNLMFNGSFENWKGSADGMPVEMKDSEYLVAFERVGLTAFPSGIRPTEKDAKVVFVGNMSYTHGGAIMSNGISILGELSDVTLESDAKLELQATKVLMDYTGKVEDLSKYDFRFEVRNADTDEVVATGRNDQTGNIVFDRVLVFDSTNCAGDQTDFTFLVTEVNEAYANVKNDPAVYRIRLTVERSQQTLLSTIPTDVGAPDDLEKVNMIDYSIETIKIEKWDANAESWAEVRYTAETPDNSDTTILTLTADGATFTNTRKTGSLTITKVVDGNYTGETFVFTVTLYNEDGSVAAINGVYDGVTFVNGVAKVEIKGSGSVTISGLPAGLTYTVEEAPNDNYTAESTGETGAIGDGATAEAIFTNHRIPESTTESEPEPSTPESSAPESSTPSPETGDDSHLFFYLLTMLLSGAVLLATALRKKNRGVI